MNTPRISESLQLLSYDMSLTLRSSIAALREKLQRAVIFSIAQQFPTRAITSEVHHELVQEG